MHTETHVCLWEVGFGVSGFGLPSPGPLHDTVAEEGSAPRRHLKQIETTTDDTKKARLRPPTAPRTHGSDHRRIQSQEEKTTDGTDGVRKRPLTAPRRERGEARRPRRREKASAGSAESGWRRRREEPSSCPGYMHGQDRIPVLVPVLIPSSHHSSTKGYFETLVVAVVHGPLMLQELPGLGDRRHLHCRSSWPSKHCPSWAVVVRFFPPVVGCR